MQELHIEEDSQLARYSFTMLEWSVVNFKMSVEAGWASILTVRFAKSYYKIDTLTCIPVTSAVISYISIPCHGLGSELSKTHIKAELWTNILSNSFSLNNPKFVNVWEFHHLIPGNVNKVQQNSAIVSNQNDLQYSFFLIELKQGGFKVHKYDVAIVAEAMHEFNRILISKQIKDSSGPVFDQSLLIYVYNDEVLSFDLQTKDEEANIENALHFS
ncbi:unnamed protein product [Rhizophagus irregularis]|nr:unnamed protein product [Rhizophagus irregularis]